MKQKLFHKKDTYKKKFNFFYSKLLLIAISSISLVFLLTTSSANATYLIITSTTSINESVNQEISHIVNQIDSTNPDVDANEVMPTLTKVVSQTAGQGSEEVNQMIIQIAQHQAIGFREDLNQDIKDRAPPPPPSCPPGQYLDTKQLLCVPVTPTPTPPKVNPKDFGIGNDNDITTQTTTESSKRGLLGLLQEQPTEPEPFTAEESNSEAESTIQEEADQVEEEEEVEEADQVEEESEGN